MNIPAQIRGEKDWNVIAQSDSIYCVDVSILKDIDIANLKLNEHHEFIFPVIRTIKGTVQDEISLTIYMRERTRNFLARFATNTRAILFLWPFFYYVPTDSFEFAGSDEQSLILYDAERADAVEYQVKFQERIIQDKLYANFPLDSEMYNKVEKIIDDITNVSTQFHAFEELEELGEAAVPYIILLMDNRKRLPKAYIALANKTPDAFEGIRHLSPKLVIDALAAILSQITRFDFGDLSNGHLDIFRNRVLNGWRIYLFYLIEGRV